jgi:hypothetical protein
MLTPEQASKLSLAEQIGEISLIPRNPDDEQTSAGTEYTIEDLLSGVDTNSREEERGRGDSTPKNDISSLSNAVREALPPAKPPFVMEILKADEDPEFKEFDPDTGKPVRQTSNPSAVGPTITPPATGAPPAASGTLEDVTKGHSEPTLENFPIDFDSAN